MSEYEDKIAAIQGMVEELSVAESILSEAEEYLQLIFKSDYDEIQRLQKEKEKIDERIVEIRTSMIEREPENAQLIEENENAKARLERMIKSECHNLPVDRLSKRGVSLVSEDKTVTVTVSKMQTAEVFDDVGLIAKYPQVQDMTCDGDPAVRRTVVPEIIMRLVEDKMLPESILEFRSVVAKRAPSVRFTLRG